MWVIHTSRILLELQNPLFPSNKNKIIFNRKVKNEWALLNIFFVATHDMYVNTRNQRGISLIAYI